MNTVQEIKQAVCQLSPEDLGAFRAWFTEFDGSIWDQHFEEDAAAGRLARLAEEAVQDLRQGRFTNL